MTNKQIFTQMFLELGSDTLEDFSLDIDGKKYCFILSSDINWEDEGKYQYATEEGRLCEVDNRYNVVKRLPFSASRNITRSGSYFSDYYYEYGEYEACEIIEVIVPEQIIPEHTTEKHVLINVDRKEYEAKKEAEAQAKIIKEKEETIKSGNMKKLYKMDDVDIKSKAVKNLEKKDIKCTLPNLICEYLDIVKRGKLKDKDWVDYWEEQINNINNNSK